LKTKEKAFFFDRKKAEGGGEESPECSPNTKWENLIEGDYKGPYLNLVRSHFPMSLKRQEGAKGREVNQAIIAAEAEKGGKPAG